MTSNPVQASPYQGYPSPYQATSPYQSYPPLDYMSNTEKAIMFGQLEAAQNQLKQGDKGFFTGFSNLVGDNVGRLFNLNGNKGKVEQAYEQVQAAILSGDRSTIEAAKEQYVKQASARDNGRKFGTDLAKVGVGTVAATTAIALAPVTGGASMVAVGAVAGGVGQAGASLLQESTDAKQGIDAGTVAGDGLSGAVGGAMGGAFTAFGGKVLAKIAGTGIGKFVVGKTPKVVQNFVDGLGKTVTKPKADVVTLADQTARDTALPLLDWGVNGSKNPMPT
jgi:hypothetical protein